MNEQTLPLPDIVVSYRPVFWEPLPGTSEKLVALVATEPHQSSRLATQSKTYSIVKPDRLKAMLGTQRGSSAANVLKLASEFMTQQQTAGLPLEELIAPFQELTIGPMFIAKGYNVAQVLDTAVRTVSAFGSADSLLEDELETPSRNTLRTTEFLRSVRRFVILSDQELSNRFNKKFQPNKELPDVTIDYAHKSCIVQVTSLPATHKQALITIQEAQSKLYEIDLLRKCMGGNAIAPFLLVNTDALNNHSPSSSIEEASKMLDRLTQLAKADELGLIKSGSPEEASEKILSLA